MDKPFLSDIKELRRRARTHMEEGAVTEAYRADRDTVLRILNEALATEIVCVLRYKRHYYMASGIHAQAVAEEFLEHAGEEQGHADLIAERITQLGGEPDLNPDGLLTRSHSEYIEGDGLVDMIKEDLVAERIAIDSYAEMIRYIGEDDLTTRRMLEGILATEEEHADDLRTLIQALGKDELSSLARQGKESLMGLWAIKYADVDEKWWVDVVLQEAPPAVSREQVGGRVVTVGFESVTGPVLARKASIPPAALEDWPSDTPVILTRAEIGPDSSLSTS